MPAEPHDPLEELRARVRATREAADRLAQELPNGAANGFERVREQSGASGGQPDLEQMIAAVLDVIRSLVPRDLQQQFVELVREFLLALRALIDWYLERIEARRPRAVEVQDIPID